jgi:nucleoside diphosphate kinase
MTSKQSHRFSVRPEARELRESLKVEFGADMLDALDRAALVVVKPDGVIASGVERVADAMATRGLATLEAWAFEDQGSQIFEEIYKYNNAARTASGERTAWWLDRQVYALGPSVAMLLTAVSGDGSASAILTEAKGPSNPYACRETHFRSELGATSRAVNVLHASDDGISAAREIIAIAGFDGLRAAGAAARAGDTKRGTERLAAVAAGLPRISRDLDFPRTIARVLLRTALSTGEGDAAQSTVELVSALDSCPSLNRRFQLLATHDERIWPALMKSRRNLLTACQQDRNAGISFAKALKGAHVPLDRWERLVIETSAFYGSDFPPVDAADQG